MVTRPYSPLLNSGVSVSFLDVIYNAPLFSGGVTVIAISVSMMFSLLRSSENEADLNSLSFLLMRVGCVDHA